MIYFIVGDAEYYPTNNQAVARRGERRERSMAGVYSCPSNRTNLEWHLRGPQIPNVTIVASVNEWGIKRIAQRAHTEGSGTRGRRWATTNHLAHYQWDERQIDTGCFKTSAIDNRNRSGVAVARGFRVNLAPHSLP